MQEVQLFSVCLKFEQMFAKRVRARTELNVNRFAAFGEGNYPRQAAQFCRVD